MQKKLELLKKFLSGIQNKPIAILTNSDVDGICAGVFTYYALTRLKHNPGLPVTPAFGCTPYDKETIILLKKLKPEALFVIDLGIEKRKIFNLPTIYIDHHLRQGEPEGALFFGDFSFATSGIVACNLFKDLIGIDDLKWLIAVGLKNESHAITRDKEKELLDNFKKIDLQEAAILINCAHRASAHNTSLAIKVLLESRNVGDVLNKENPFVSQLYSFREEVKAEQHKALHARPYFMWKVAFIPFESKCDISSLLAEIWKENLSDYIVITANRGLVEGKISFSVSTKTDINLVRFMEKVKPPYLLYPLGLGNRSHYSGMVDREIFENLLYNLRFKDIKRLI